MYTLYEKYENIQKFIVEYRKYVLKDGVFLNYDDFKNMMQTENYMMHACLNLKKNCPVYIYIFNENSNFLKSTTHFKKLLDRLPVENADVIIITKAELSVYILKSVHKFTHLNTSNYLHKYFSIEISKGPLCSPHYILSDADVKTLCSQDLMVHPLSLPAISLKDPQNIWIGGECGQVIKIVSISELTGGVVRYRIVSPDSGKILSNTTYNDDLISDSEKQGDVQESIDVEQHHIDDIISDDDAD